MSSKEGTPYMIRSDAADEDGWVAPEPADEVITEAVVEATDLDADDLDDLSAYVDVSTLAAVLDGTTGETTFSVEGHDVLVTSDGDVTVDGT